MRNFLTLLVLGALAFLLWKFAFSQPDRLSTPGVVRSAAAPAAPISNVIETGREVGRDVERSLDAVRRR